jgi:membrane protease YdiL (CAAX protease family)
MFSPLFWLLATILLWGAYWGLLCLVLCLPYIRQAPRRLGAAALACVGQACASVFPPWFYWARWLGFEPPTTWVSPLYHPVDWTGKVASLLVVGVVVYGLKWVTPAEAGLTKFQSGSWRPVGLVVTVVAVALVLNAYFTRQTFPLLWWNERLYYATLPGLAEELFYRGVLLGLLSRVFVRRLPLFGTRTSWGGVVGVILFAIAHELKFPSYLLASLQNGSADAIVREAYSWFSLGHVFSGNQVYYLAMGTLFLWVREWTGSCWAAVGAHCLLNTCLTIGASLG